MVLVGDRGMISRVSIGALRAEQFSWITALKNGQVRTLVDSGELQLGLFDERNLCELKAITHQRDDGAPVHSFRTLLDELATILSNTCRVPGRAPLPATFAMVTTPNALQGRARKLIDQITGVDRKANRKISLLPERKSENPLIKTRTSA